MFIPKKKKTSSTSVCVLKRQGSWEGDQPNLPAPESRPTGRPDRAAGSGRTIPTWTRTIF